MATVTLPTRTDGTQRYSFTATLGGSNFGFELTWNLRDSAWYMQVSDSSNNLLLSKKITVGTPMTWRYFAGQPTLPLGEFVAVDTSGQDIDPGLTDLGGRVLLTFTDASDFATPAATTTAPPANKLLSASIVAVGTNGTPIPAASYFASSSNGVQFPTLAAATIATLSAWAGSHSYSAFTPFAVGSLVANGGNIYACTQTGQSAASGGPTGTGSSITDGGCVWSYVASGSAAAGILVAQTVTPGVTEAAGVLTVIVAPISGLSSVTNALAAA